MYRLHSNIYDEAKNHLRRVAISLQTENDNKILNLDEAAYNYFKDPSKEKLTDVILVSERLISYFGRLYGGGNSKDDLYQIGIEGLLKALKGYKTDGGASFSTYAGHCIIGEIRHYVRKEASFYCPGCLVELRNKIDRFMDEVFKETGDLPSIEEISKHLNINRDSVEEVMKSGFVSMEELDISKITTLKYQTFQLPIEDKISIEQAIKKLSDVQKKVVNLLFYKNMTQQEASKQLGVNQRQVSRIKQRVLYLLRREMSEKID